MASIPRAPFYAPRPSDDPVWTGAPIDSALIQQLTHQKVFGAGGQVRQRHFAAFIFDDCGSFWEGEPLGSEVLPLLTQQKMQGAGGQVVSKRWAPVVVSFDDASFWEGEPVASAVIPLLTQQVMYGKGGQVPTKRYSPFTYDDPAFWEGEPLGSEVIPLLTLQKMFGAGGQVALRPWDVFYTLDDASFWQGAPASSAAIPLLTQQKMYRAGGQVPTKQWRYDWDDSAPWWNWITKNLSVGSATHPTPTSARQPRFDVDDSAPCWTWTSKNLVVTIPPVVVPVGPLYVPRPSDDPYWEGEPLASEIISLLTQQRVQGAGGQVVTRNFSASYTYDDSAPWWRWQNRNAAINLKIGEPFALPISMQFFISADEPWQRQPQRNTQASLVVLNPFALRQPRYDIDDAAVWTGSPTTDRALISTPNVPVATARQWRYGDDAAAAWSGAPLASYTLHPLLTAAGQVQSRQWLFGYDDASSWLAAPVSSKTIPLLTVGGQVKSSQLVWNFYWQDDRYWQLSYQPPAVRFLPPPVVKNLRGVVPWWPWVTGIPQDTPSQQGSVASAALYLAYRLFAFFPSRRVASVAAEGTKATVAVQKTQATVTPEGTKSKVTNVKTIGVVTPQNTTGKPPAGT